MKRRRFGQGEQRKQVIEMLWLQGKNKHLNVASLVVCIYFPNMKVGGGGLQGRLSRSSPFWSRHHCFSITFMSVPSNFFCCDKLPEKNQLLGGKIYLGSWFLRFLSMVI